MLNVVVGLLAVLKLRNIVSSIRSLVRPSLTWLMTIAFVYFLDQGNVEAAKTVAAPMGIMIGFWFNSRENKEIV